MPGFHNLTPTIPNVKKLIIQMMLHGTTVTAQQIHARRTESDKHHITSYALSSECIMVTHDLLWSNTNLPTLGMDIWKLTSTKETSKLDLDL